MPQKKNNLVKIYSQLLNFLKKARKGFNAKNVEDVQFWLGDIFILLCENKDVIDVEVKARAEKHE